MPLLKNEPSYSRPLAFCPQCGTEVTPDAAFCTKCGSPLKGITQGLSSIPHSSPEELQFADFLLPSERLLFWAPGAELHPTLTSTGHLSSHAILSYQAGMYQGRNVSVGRTVTGGAHQQLSGTLLLTDKRMLLIHKGGMMSSNLINLEIFYDAELVRQIVKIFGEHNAPLLEKYNKGYFAQTKMFYSGQLGKIVDSVYVLSDFVPEKKLRLAKDRGSILASAIGHKMKSFTISSLMLHTGKKEYDRLPRPVKTVYHEDFGFTLSEPWSAGAFLLAATDVLWYAAMAAKYRTKETDYDPIFEVVESKKQAMADLINELVPPSS